MNHIRAMNYFCEEISEILGDYEKTINSVKIDEVSNALIDQHVAVRFIQLLQKINTNSNTNHFILH